MTAAQPATRLRGPWLVIVRVLWVALAALTAGVLVYASWIDHAYFSTLEGWFAEAWTPEAYNAALAQLGLSANSLDLYNLLSATFIRAVYIGTSAVIFWRKADDLMAFVLSISLLTFSVTAIWLGPIATSHPLLARPIDLLQVVGQTGLLLAFFIFPDGRFVPRWARWPTLATLALFVLVRYNPWLRDVATSNRVFWLAILWMFACVPLQIYRYWRVSNPIQRQQTKWALVGFAGFIVLSSGTWVFSYAIAPSVFPAIQQQSANSLLFNLVRALIQYVGYLSLPVCLAVAILRYRLFDIDIIIRKTLQYTAVTALLALIYFGSVFLLQRLFSSVTGQASPVALVVSTLLIAALFAPLRRRIQDGIDRRFYRKKYDAQQVLAQFARTARDETDLEALVTELERVIQETLQPKHVNVWLRGARTSRGGQTNAVQEMP